WGFAGSLPPDCDECKQADGGGLGKLADFLMRKHSNATVAMVSGMEDEIIRLFYSTGLKECSAFDTADPVGIVTASIVDPTAMMTGAQYTAGLNQLRTTYVSTNRFATYFIGGAAPLPTYHQHLWRDRFYLKAAGDKTIAAFVTDWLNGTIAQVGP